MRDGMGMVSPPGVQDVGGRESVQGPAGLLQGRPNHRGGMGFHGFFPCNNPHGRVARGELDEIFGSNQHHGSLVVNI